MDTCPAIPACPEGAIRHVVDRSTKLGGRIVFELSVCNGCGDCVSACCGNAISLAEIIPMDEEKSTEGDTHMLTIKVLGSGCANCQNLAARAQQAIHDLSIEARIEKVTDFTEIMKYKILATPGLVINEKVVSAGRVPSEAEITTFLTNALTERESV
jgi:small redox-active disulfide protein 2